MQFAFIVIIWIWIWIWIYRCKKIRQANIPMDKVDEKFQFHLRIRKDFNDRIRKILHEVIKQCFLEFILNMHNLFPHVLKLSAQQQLNFLSCFDAIID